MASLKDFQILSKLGEGAYSSVYKVRRLSDGLEYGLKRVRIDKLSEKEKQNALNEIRILASIRNPTVICYKEAFLDDTRDNLCIVMEFANDGDLFQKIVEHQKKGSYFSEKEIWNVLIQVTKGLKALHNLKILHRDLKSANVFMNKDGTVKLGDMNVSKVNKKGLLFTQTGTPYYASPEVWKDQPYDHKSDIWSLGCVIYEMTTLKPPFRAEDMEGLYKKVIRGYYQRIPSQYSQDLSNVIRSLLQVSPHLRPNCDKILMLPAIAKHIDDNHLYEIDEGTPFLLNTIRVPFKLFHYLTDKLPKPNYSPLKTRKIDKSRFLQTLANPSRPELPQVDPHSYSVETLPRMGVKNSQDDHLPKINSQNQSKERNRPVLKPNPTRMKKSAKKNPIKESASNNIDSILEAEAENDRRRENRHKRQLKKKKELQTPSHGLLLPQIDKKSNNDSILPPINHKKVERTNEILKIYGANIHLKEDRVKNNRHLKLKKPIIERSSNNREELVREPGYIPKELM